MLGSSFTGKGHSPLLLFSSYLFFYSWCSGFSMGDTSLSQIMKYVNTSINSSIMIGGEIVTLVPAGTAILTTII